MRPTLPRSTPLLAAAWLAACGGGSDPATVAERGAILVREALVVDTHIDLPDRLHRRPADVAQRTADGHFDWPRANEGGLDAAFLSIYVPAALQETGGAKAYADELIDLVEDVAARSPDKFAVAHTPAGVRAVAAMGRVALALGIENGAALETDLANVAHFHERGVRYITLAHSKANAIADSSYDPERRWHGLSPFGREVVREMNRLGILVDVSHVTDEAAAAAIELSAAPVIASHSSCRALTPGFERNLSDELIRAIAAKDGVVQINFGSAFLTDAAQKAAAAGWAAIEAYRTEHGLADGSPEERAFADAYWRERPVPATTIDDVVAHIDHVVRLVGVEHVGFGSDFDGVRELPAGLEDVSKYPALIVALLSRGYSESDVRKIAGENLLRAWAEAERVASRSSAAGS